MWIRKAWTGSRSLTLIGVDILQSTIFDRKMIRKIYSLVSDGKNYMTRHRCEVNALLERENIV